MLKSRIPLPELRSEFSNQILTPFLKPLIHKVYASNSYSPPSYLPESCPLFQKYHGLMERCSHRSDIGEDVTLIDDCKSFMDEYKEYSLFPGVTKITCSCGIPGIRHLPYVLLVDYLVHHTSLLLLQICFQPSQWILQRIQQQRDKLRGDEDVLPDVYWVFELCMQTVEICIDELLKSVIKDEMGVTELRSQGFSIVSQMIRDYRKQHFFSFTEFTSIPVSLRLSRLFLDRQYDFTPSLPQLSRNFIWMVPLAIPSFLSTEIELNSDLLQVQRNLQLFLKNVLRSPSSYPKDLFVTQIACLLTAALDLYYSGYGTLQTSLNDYVSVFRSNPLMLSWYVLFVTSLKGVRPGQEFAKKLETEWMGKELYLKRELIRCHFCTNN